MAGPFQHLIPAPLPARRAAGVCAGSVLNLLLLERHGHVLYGDALHDGGERVEVAVLCRIVRQEVICEKQGWHLQGVAAGQGRLLLGLQGTPLPPHMAAVIRGPAPSSHPEG